MGLVPLTPFVPAAGVIETSCRPAAGCSGLYAVTELAEDTSEAWLPGVANATIATPAPSTSAALPAVRATPRLFNGRGALEARQKRLAAGVSLSASNVCGLRNHPDPDTATFPPRVHNWTKVKGRTLEASKITKRLLLQTDAHAQEKVAGLSRSRPPAEACWSRPPARCCQ